MIGGDERAAIHHLLGAIASGDQVGTLADLETLLLVLGRTDAAALVQRTAVVVGELLRPAEADEELVVLRREHIRPETSDLLVVSEEGLEVHIDEAGSVAWASMAVVSVGPGSVKASGLT